MGAHFLLLIPLLGAAAMVYGWPFTIDNDIYLHLKTGQLTWELGHILREDIFTFTSAGHPDETHSWGSQVIFWLLYRAFGPNGLYALNFLLVAIMLCAVWHFVWQRTRSAPWALGLTTCALLLHHHMQTIRPLLFGEALFAVLFLVLWPRGAFSWRRLAAASALVLAWANLHGSVIVVLPVFALHALQYGRESRASLFAPLAALLAVGANPMGFGYFAYVFAVSRVGHATGNSEWMPLGVREYLEGKLPFEILVAQWDIIDSVAVGGLLLLAWRMFRERAAWLDHARTAYFLLMPFVSYRHAVYLIHPIAVLGAWLASLSWPRVRDSEILVTGLAGLALLWPTPIYESGPTVDSIANAATFLEQAGVEGNVYNYAAFGNYLTFRLCPRLRVAYDQRTWVNEKIHLLWQQYRDRPGGFVLREFLKEFPRADFVFVPSGRVFSDILDVHEWLLIYENDSALIAIRRDERNRANLQRVENCYRSRRVPFDPARGYDTARVWAENTRWLVEQQEKPQWGRWPAKGVKEMWARDKTAFFYSRGLSVRRAP